MLVTEAKRQVVAGALQGSIPGTMLAPVDILMSASAFAQTKVLIIQRKAVMTVIAKSYRRDTLIIRLEKFAQMYTREQGIDIINCITKITANLYINNAVITMQIIICVDNQQQNCMPFASIKHQGVILSFIRT